MSNNYASTSAVPFAYRSDVYTATGNGVTLTPSAPVKHFTIQCVQIGTVTLWTIVVEGSLDGINFSTLATHTQATLTGVLVSATSPAPVRFLRSRCATLTLGVGTSVTAHVLAMS